MLVQNKLDKEITQSDNIATSTTRGQKDSINNYKAQDNQQIIKNKVM